MESEVAEKAHACCVGLLRRRSSLTLRLDVLVEAEGVGRVVLALDLVRRRRVASRVSLADVVGALVGVEVDVDARRLVL